MKPASVSRKRIKRIFWSAVKNVFVGNDTWQNFVWGWLRMILGILQLTLAPLALLVLFKQGIEDELTWVLVILTTLITGISRLLYNGRRTPEMKDKLSKYELL